MYKKVLNIELFGVIALKIYNSEITFIVHHLPGTSSAVPLIAKSIDRQSIDCLFLCLKALRTMRLIFFKKIINYSELLKKA